MDSFINANEKDPQVRIKIYDMLDRYNTLCYNFTLKMGCDSLLQNDILRGLEKLLDAVLTDLDLELKMKSIRLEYL